MRPASGWVRAVMNDITKAALSGLAHLARPVLLALGL
jgi:hypothetical protein